MGKKRVYYKAVREHSGKLLSALDDHLRYFGMSVEYKVGEFAYPALEHTKLMVFSDIEEAKEFAHDYFSNLYECEIVNPQKKAPFIASVFSGNFKTNLLRLIEIKKKGKKYFGENGRDLGLADGTDTRPCYNSVVFCDAVKLTKRIDL